MRIHDGHRKRARIFVSERAKWHHEPLHRALLDRLRREGFAGATVLHGIAGFGADKIVHTASIVDLSADLPIVIEVVDDDERIERLLSVLDEMITGRALVTVEGVRVVEYGAERPPDRS